MLGQVRRCWWVVTLMAMLVVIWVVLETFMGGFGIGQINDGGIRLLDWVVGKGLCLMNTCFKKRKSWHIKFILGETEAMIDYILVSDKYRSSVKNVKVIPGEEIVSQHCLLLMNVVFKKKVREKVKFRKKLKLWRLRESEVKEEFAEGANNKCDGNEDWCGLKRKLLDIASEVCGYTKGKHRHFETCWWNKDVDVAVCRKRELFKIWKQSQNEEDREKYWETKKYIWLWIRKLERWCRRLICVVIIVSCLELPSKRLGRRKTLGLVVLRKKVGW